MLSNQRYDWVLHDQATPRISAPKIQISDHGRDPGTGSRARKVPGRKNTPRKRQSKGRQGIYIFKFDPASRASPQECVGRIKKWTMDRCTYMRLSSVGPMDASSVEPPSIGMMST